MYIDYLTSKYKRTLDEGWGAVEVGNLEKAEEHFRFVLKHHADPHMTAHDLVDAHAGLGAISMVHKDFFEATRWYKEAYHLLTEEYKKTWPEHLTWRHPHDRAAMRTLIGLGHLAYHKGKKKEATDYYQKLLDADHKDELGVRQYAAALSAGDPFPS